MELRKALSASPFAHLLGMSKARAEDEDPKKQREGESDDDYAKRMDDDKKKDEEAKKAEDKKKEDEKAENEKDGDEEMKGDSPAAQARNRERARCAAIFATPAAGKRPDLAAHLAFSTVMPRADAIALLEATASGEAPRSRGALASRMESVKIPNPGSGGAEAPSATDPTAVAAAVVAAGKKRRGEV